MTDAPHMEYRPWSTRKWGLTVLGLFGLQVAVVWVLGKYPSPREPGPMFQTQIDLVENPWHHASWQTYQSLGDPALLPLPGPKGFSGEGWLQFESLEHQLAEWEEIASWLSPDPQSLGGTFQHRLESELLAPTRITDESLPAPAVDAVAVTTLMPRGKSTLRIDGDLTRAQLETPMALPSWPHGAILTNSVIQIMVEPDGLVFSAALLQSCGLPDADAVALEKARESRFAAAPAIAGSRAPSNAIRLATMRFGWHTKPLPEVNTTAKGG